MNKLIILLALLSADAAAADEDLPLIVQAALNVRQIPADSLSVYVQDVDSGQVILSLNADVARNPASTMKLLTTLVALDVLGPSYT